MSNFASIGTVSLILAAFLFVSSEDYAAQANAHRNYCKMVSEGYWPDYRGIYREACPSMGGDNSYLGSSTGR